MTLTIYHNPRCSKSRQTLALIEAAGVTPNIVKYLDNPLDAATLDGLLKRLGYESARDMMRTKEAIYKELDLKTISDEYLLIEAMVKHPKLIERPIVDDGEQAIMGRPPENVQTLLQKIN